MPLTPLPILPTAPNSVTRPLTFNADSDAYFDTLNSFQVSYNLNIPLLNAASQAALDGATAASESAAQAVEAKALAAAAQAAAEDSAADAAAAVGQLDLLRQHFLGTAAADPATRPGGGALQPGDWYINTGSGYLRAYNGAAWVQGIAAVAGVSSVNGQVGAVNGVATQAGEETLQNKTISGSSNALTADGTNAVGFREIPQNSQSAAYTCVLADSGKHILHPSADTTARIFTIPANSAVAYPIGTAITFINQASAGVVTIAVTTDTMRLAGAGTTGSRTLAANGVATVIKLTATEWIISGTGLT